MAYTAILRQIRLLIPAKLDGHYEAVRRALGRSDGSEPVDLGYAISPGSLEFHGLSPERSLDRDPRETP